MSATGRSVTVRVPATSANLGTGFDALGLAVALHNRVTLEVVAADDPARTDAGDSLPVAAYERACAEHGIEPVAVRCTVAGDVPPSRGLGSSATCVVGGVLAARALHGTDWDDDELVRLGTLTEGHPDNVAPALLGGVVVSVAAADGRVHSVPVPVAPGALPEVLLLVPDHPVATAEARAALPASVPFADAVHNAARSALLVAALATGRTEALSEAVDDRLHQPHRAHLVPGVEDVLAAARASGASAACVSGAGPTLLVLSPATGTEAALSAHLADHPWSWQLRRVPLEAHGAAVEESVAA
ncbi:homoserine kinase [Kytococcus schroeteri]|uniref:Homoserine kinase n=1 Tax=Kytococcus schroeteri TaxID=138300 RepID=A0A2I1PDQ4_9MICO|nr:homoserine kinase [Kytococcus schroeteri]PKZ42745.1 homoserine kinase [Kytococcus schroeteri]